MPIESLNIRSVFDRAAEITTDADRKAYLDEVCVEAPYVREQVEALLMAHANAGSFLEQAFLASDQTANHKPPITEQPGTVIGPYMLLRQIGEGGMGIVFMAEQAEPIRRTVALKIIKPGMDTRQVIARFEAERQSLAMMDHPNIARVVDAGTTDAGRPYFVMDLVKGVPITDYCDQRELSLRQRLELMIAVCHAVQHAHQKGIIHRDIKPTNVLVAEYDNQAVAKVIDFGVAKATAQRLNAKTAFTEYGQLIGTFEYMSPEQVQFKQLDIDTRSDIYSLGVLLYELLTGGTPFEKNRLETVAFDETLRIIREEEPPRPSARLSSSRSLPSIAANRQTEPARLSRLVRGELDWIVMKALEKDRNRRYDTASALAGDIERYLNDDPVIAGPPSRLYRTAKYVRRNKGTLIASGLIVAALLTAAIGASVGMVSESRRRAAAELNLANALALQERFAEAEDSYRKALVDRAGSKSSADVQEAAVTLFRLARAVLQQDRVDDAEQILRDTITAYRRAFPPSDRNIARPLNELAFLYRDRQHRYTDAEKLFREALDINRRATPVDHNELGKSLLYVGNVLSSQQKYADAEPLYRQSVAEYKLAFEPNDASLALAQIEYGIVLMRLDRLAQAESLLLQSESVLRSNPPWRLYSAATITCLYAKMDQADPGKGYDLKVREWSSKILDGYFPLNSVPSDSPDKPKR